MRQLSEVLPASVLKRLAEQFREGINQAVIHYPELRGDEDSVTGGLIQAIGGVAKGADPASGYSWSAATWKLRGRGGGAPEKKIGADAVLEIQVKDPAGDWLRASLFRSSRRRNGYPETNCYRTRRRRCP